MLNVSLKQLQEWIPFLLIATLFFIPISLTLKSICIITSTLAILLTPSYRTQLASIFSQKWNIAALIFFFIAFLACFWSSADYHLRFSFLEKYSKLLYLPILTVGFRERKTRIVSLYAFLLAITITCIASIFKTKGDAGEVFHNHIVTSYMMAFGAYLAALFAIQQHGVKRAVFITLTFLFTYQIIFVNTGRLGYILYATLMLLLLLQTFPLKYTISILLCVFALSTLSIYQKSEMSNGLHRTVSEWNNYQHGEKNSSLGERFQFHQFAKSLFLMSPFAGQGIAGFVNAVQRDHFFPERKLADPHSQYWLVAAEFGLLGLVALFYFFGSLWAASFHLNDMRPVMIGLLVSFILANFSDSLLLYSAVGYFFIVLSALCLGELVEHPAFQTKPRLRAFSTAVPE
jgi:O-antigen ligase